MEKEKSKLSFITGFFKEGTKESMMRLTMWMGVVFVILYPFGLLLKDVELTTVHVSLELGIAGIAYGAKVTQKKLSEK